MQPLWVVIFSAVGGGIVGLIANFGTTILANRQALSRQKAEHAHARHVERDKLLFSARFELYAAVLRLLMTPTLITAGCWKRLSERGPG